jgi:hypothetical protein
MTSMRIILLTLLAALTPLACGGPDDPSSMQWQTVEAAKKKDKWERRTCGGQ